MRTTKRIIILPDMHCGHQVGLTPPAWNVIKNKKKHIYAKLKIIRDQCWDFTANMVKKYHKPDILIVPGDMVDGRGDISGSLEQLELDRKEQASMAAHCINMWQAKKIVMTYGTEYHTGKHEDWEDLVFEKTKAKQKKIGAHEWIDVNGVIIDIKHYISGSAASLTSLGNALKREILSNFEWSVDNMQPRADILIRGHVHRYYKPDNLPRELGVIGMTLPSLQAMGSRFGARKCRGKVDYGIVEIVINNKKEVVVCKAHLAKIEAQRAKAIVL